MKHTFRQFSAVTLFSAAAAGVFESFRHQDDLSTGIHVLIYLGMWIFIGLGLWILPYAPLRKAMTLPRSPAAISIRFRIRPNH